MQTETNELNLSKAPLLAHLMELRQRIFYCLLFLSLAFSISYYFSEEIYRFLLQPLERVFANDARHRHMIYTGLHEAFFTYLKVSFFAAFFFTLPLILIQIWRFIAPGLYKDERKSAMPLFVLTPVLFIAGAMLAFYVVIPLAWEFFVSFETQGNNNHLAVQLEARVSEYLGLITQLILAFGLSFELPILLLVLAKAGIITAEDLLHHRRHAVVVAFLIAALITPPDLISQIALGTPILILYQISIWLIRWTSADKKTRLRRQITLP